MSKSQVDGLLAKVVALNHDRAAGVEGSHESMLEAIDHLKYAVQTPWETLWETRFQTLNSMCRRMALEMGIAHGLAKRNGAPVTVQDLSAETPHDSQAVERVLRVLANIHIVDQVSDTAFASNDVTKLLCSAEGAASEKYFFDFLFPIGADLVKCIRETGLRQFPEPGEQGPFEYTFGAPIFDYLSAHPDMKQNFDAAMAGRRDGGPIQWFNTYPAMRELAVDGDKTVLVDVAGNKGHDLVAFKQSHPTFQGTLVLEDLPATFEHMTADERAAVSNAGVQTQEYDFFTPQPIKGARAYFFRDICHDWPDKQSRQFLSQTAQAMKPGYSKLLIEDHVLDEQGAHHRPAASDVLMMLVLTGIERTKTQWQALLDSAGLEIVKIWPSRRGHQSVIEAVRKTGSYSNGV